MSDNRLPIILVVHPHTLDERACSQWTQACCTPVRWLHQVADDLDQAWSAVAGEPVPRILLRVDCEPGWRGLDRALAALRAAGADAVVVPLGNRSDELFPLLPGSPSPLLPTSRFDAACRLLAEPVLLPCRSGVATAMLAAGAEVVDLHAARWLLDCRHYVPIADGVKVPQPLPADVRERAPEPLWAALATTLAILPARFQPAFIGLDGRPVVLHLLHGWGGGAERWVLDLAAVDSQRHHLILRADGNAGRSRHGERLQLLDARQPQQVLREFRLSPEIVTLHHGHPQYRELLAQLVREFAVDQIWISSLIGHALDALDVPRELRWIAHDYFPFWPVLHVDFGDRSRRFDAEELAADLAHADGGAMALEEAPLWLARRDRVVQALRARAAPMVGPDRTVHDNLLRIAPQLAELPWSIIAHGIELEPLAPLDAELEPTQTPHRLRVLVPGRIQGGKGLQLLLPALDGLLEHCDLYLLGCGAAGMKLFGRTGVHVELDFEHAELPALIRRICPDIALLPRTVAETFSYVLSEMWTLGVPVLATRMGSLATRITDGVDGWLCEPEAAALVAAVAALAAQPDQVQRVAQSLVGMPVRTRLDMLADYQVLLPDQHRQLPADPTVATAAQLSTLQQAGRAERLALDLSDQRQRAEAAEAEMLRRGDWGQSLQRLVDERTRWAQGLEVTLNNERSRSEALESAHAQAVLQLGQRMDALQAALQAGELQLQQALAEQTDLLERLRLTDDFLKRAEAELAAERKRLAEVFASSSWRLAAPLRVLVRQQRRLRESLAYRLRSLRQLARRGMASLRQRGVAATLERVLRGAPKPPAISIETQPLAGPETPFQPFDLPDRGLPRVSIIIPVYNKFDYTEACLRSLARVQDDSAFETIVVDDGSSDATWTNLQQITGIVAYRNLHNLGFIGACNKGAELARGDYVFFLNNDTQVQDGFLAELLKVFASHPDAGLVGSKLIYPDGRLQECGGIIFSDGSGWNYGRFEDPQHAYYGYVREVDYVSGAAIALRRDLFNQLGGFDTLYAPAYYEDTDLAFKVRAQAGLKVYVAPASRVVHFEGVTSGTDLASGIKRYQVVNQEKFLARWATQLAGHPTPGSSILKARQHRARRRVLIIDACTPMPDQDSGSLRMFNLLRLLLEDGAAVCFFNEDRAYHPGYAEALQALGVEMLFHPWLGDIPTFFRERGHEFDLVILSRHYVAERFLPLVKDHAPQAQLWFDTVDLHYLRERRAAELTGDAHALKAAAQTQAQECALMQRCDLTLVVSSVEQSLLAVECPVAKVEVLSNIHEIPGRAGGVAGRRDLCFVGGFQHPPNVDAVLWFAQQVWPLVLAQAPDLVLHLIGSRTPAEISALASERIVVHGFVADLDPFMAGCRLSIAPLRYGAGVKGKVNMSMSHGLPVVATSVAVEGMFLESGVDALIADSPEEFAAAVLRLCQDDALWLHLSDASLANVQRHFSLDAARAVLRRLLAPT